MYDAMAGKDTFLMITKEIAEYRGSYYEEAREFRTGMVELSLPTITMPKLPDDKAMAVDLEQWKWERGSTRTRSSPEKRMPSNSLHLSLANAPQHYAVPTNG